MLSITHKLPLPRLMALEVGVQVWPLTGEAESPHRTTNIFSHQSCINRHQAKTHSQLPTLFAQLGHVGLKALW